MNNYPMNVKLWKDGKSRNFVNGPANSSDPAGGNQIENALAKGWSFTNDPPPPPDVDAED